jgi:hypothetical protein
MGWLEYINTDLYGWTLGVVCGMMMMHFILKIFRENSALVEVEYPPNSKFVDCGKKNG